MYYRHCELEIRNDDNYDDVTAFDLLDLLKIKFLQLLQIVQTELV